MSDRLNEDHECVFCSASFPWDSVLPAEPAEVHDPDCLWVRAQQAVDGALDNPAGWMPYAEVPPRGFEVWFDGHWVHPGERRLYASTQPHELVLARQKVTQ
jgi:hypothetical protein